MSKVLITGGAGFIGRAVTKKLADEGLDVVTFDLREPVKLIGRHITGTIMYTDELQKAMKGCDYVVHLAAMLGVQNTETNRTGCLEVNNEGTRNVFEACLKAKVKKIVFASSSEVYGEPYHNPVSEKEPVMPKSIYAVTKLTGEEYARAYKEEFGLDFVITRFFNAYGPGQLPKFVMPRYIQSVINNERPTVFGAGTQSRCFCHVDDTAQGVFLALTKPAAVGQTFNIGNDKTEISMADLARKVIKISGRKLEPLYVKMKDSDRTEAREIMKRTVDISKARKVLGFKPTIGLDEGIKNILMSEGYVFPKNKKS